MLSRLNHETLFNENLQKDVGVQKIVGWSPCNATISDKEPSVTTIGYCPIIQECQREYKTVYDAMKTMMTVTNKLMQEKQH